MDEAIQLKWSNITNLEKCFQENSFYILNKSNNGHD